MKDINMQLVDELDTEFPDLIGLLNFDKPKMPITEKQNANSFENIAHSLKQNMVKVQPLKGTALTEKEHA